MWFMITSGTRWVARHATSVAGAFSAASKVRRYSIGTVQCWPHTGRQSGMITHHNLATNADRTRPRNWSHHSSATIADRIRPEMRVVIAASSLVSTLGVDCRRRRSSKTLHGLRAEDIRSKRLDGVTGLLAHG
jgi:hypothetical protein